MDISVSSKPLPPTLVDFMRPPFGGNEGLAIAIVVIAILWVIRLYVSP